MLPESVVKTLKIKDLLKNDPSMSIFEAVKKFDLSRSAFTNIEILFFQLMKKWKKRVSLL